MTNELLFSAMMVALTVVIHGFGLILLERVLNHSAQTEDGVSIADKPLRRLLFTIILVLGLFAIHIVEIWSYALLYVWIDALPDLRSAVYFSAITYTTIGYDDQGFAEAWSLVSAFEGVNGVILLGWSTAFFVTKISKLSRAD